MDLVVVKQETTDLVMVKQETIEEQTTNSQASSLPASSDLNSNDSSEGDSHDETTANGKRTRASDDDCNGDSNKKQKAEFIFPLRILDPLLPHQPQPLLLPPSQSSSLVVSRRGSKQFWKAGDYEDEASLQINNVGGGSNNYSSVGMDHVRVHPKFLHSNATSHKWALGAIAELLDNSLDEVCYGATFVNIDVLENSKDVGSKMLLVEDNGGGMDPDRMRQCMSLGYSAKSKLANVIGQYGNGFKTSTMRLGADVIVFSRCCRGDKAPTQSIGLLSYTFLKSTGKEDIVVPMLDFEKGEDGAWKTLIRSSPDDWTRNAETIVQWSPYSSETELYDQFNLLGDHGTRIVIYNLWEDDQGELELDFTEQHDIQIRGASRNESKIKMAAQYPNSRHFLTYSHSLRSYAAILYLRLPPRFRIVLRGKEVEHHDIVDDMILAQKHTYRPTQASVGGVQKDPNMLAHVTVGFVKDAKEEHIDVQGFNVYHKNRLIKPFWRVWNAAGSDGRGVIGVLEANFVEPAHDKQGFERTTVLQRLEQRLVTMQKTYWRSQCHEIGYAPRQQVKLVNASATRQTARDGESLADQSSKSTPPLAQNPLPQNSQSSAPPLRQTTPHSSAPPLALTPLRQSTPYLSQSPSAHTALQQNAPPPLSQPFTCLSQKPLQPNTHFFQSFASLPPQIPLQQNSRQFFQSFAPSAQNLPQQITQSPSPLVQTPFPQTTTPHHSQPSYNFEVKLEHAYNEQMPITQDQPRKKVGGVCNRDNVHASETNLSYLNHFKDIENRRLKDIIKTMEEKIRSLEAQLQTKVQAEHPSPGSSDLIQLSTENRKLEFCLNKMHESLLCNLNIEKQRSSSLEAQLNESKLKMEQMNKEQERLNAILSEERNQRDNKEAHLNKKLKDASNAIHILLNKTGYQDKFKAIDNIKQENGP